MEQPTQTPSGTPVDGTPETIEVEIAGQKQTFTKQQLAEGVMRQQDYSRKTQELAQQRTELETLQGRLQGYEQFETLLNNDPELAQEVASVIETRRSNSTPQGEFKEPGSYGQPGNYDQTVEMPQDIKDRLAFVENGLARTELRTTIEELVRQYPNANVDATIRYALDHNLGVDLPTAYKAMSFDTVESEAREKGEKIGAQKIIEAISSRNLSDLETGKGSSPNLQGVQMTAEQRNYAKLLGLSDDDYLKGMEKREIIPGQRAKV